MAVQTVRSLPLRSHTELEISRHYNSFYDSEEFRPMELDSGTPRGGLENLRHLGLKGQFTWEKDGEVKFGQLIRTAVNNELLRPQYHCSRTIMPNTLHFINARRLRYLQLERGFISAKELTYLLKNCKQSIRYIDITAELRHGSVLQLLFQMSRSLKLFDFYFCLPYIRDVDAVKIEELENGLRQDIRNEKILCLYAYNDIQHQVKANRLAAGLIPLQERGNIHVETPPLKSVMEKAHYQELCSLPEL